jgi:alkylation response protein AidB-like acyl-CoA dehydrogenase
MRTRAEPCTEGRDGWLINSQKVWTTLAQFAGFGMVLTRTNPEVPKLEGMTKFFIDMKSVGVEVRPIRQANGESEFNEIFVNDVFVPGSQRVGAPGAGWKVTLTGLMNERLSIGGVMPAELWRTAAGMMCEATFNDDSALADGRMRERLADLYLNAQGLWLLQCRGLTALGKAREPALSCRSRRPSRRGPCGSSLTSRLISRAHEVCWQPVKGAKWANRGGWSSGYGSARRACASPVAPTRSSRTMSASACSACRRSRVTTRACRSSSWPAPECAAARRARAGIVLIRYAS